MFLADAKTQRTQNIFVGNLLNALLALFLDFFSLLDTIPAAALITSMTKHFIFHIC